MEENVKVLFNEQYPVEGMEIDCNISKPQKAITSLPKDFKIKAMSDIRTLQEYVAINYSNRISLYRGHESQNYKLESTIVRLLKNNKKCCVQDVIDAEEKGFKMFCLDVFKEKWLCNKLKNSDETLFKMSIGRHLGLPCRLIDVTASLETAVWFAVMNPKFYNVDGEIVFLVVNKDNIEETSASPFSTNKVSYAQEPFMADSLNDIPLGEQRRYIQCGHFIWVDNNSLLNEQQSISDSAIHITHFTIPREAKIPLATELYRDVYSGCAYQSDIAKIKNCIMSGILNLSN